MRAPNLDSRITIEQRGSTIDAAGQPVDAWTPVTGAWAEIRYLSGVETIKAAAEVATARASICIHRREGLSAGMRVRHRDTVFDVEAVLPDERERLYTFLACSTGAKNG